MVSSTVVVKDLDGTIEYAGIAQSVEQLIRNQQVAGSSPVTSSSSSQAI